MAAEIELKLTLDPAALKAFRASPVLAGVRPSRQRVFNTYFDTPDCELARARMALRLRRIGRRWLQTLKTAGTAMGGLQQRGEWEFPVPDASIDLALFRETPLAEMKDVSTLHERLQPAFTTDFLRTRWVVEPAPGQQVEVALDVGEVRAGDAVEPICEVELELLAGEPAMLIALAHELVQSLPLMPARASKAERGYRLFRGEPLAAMKARPVKLDGDASPMQGLRTFTGAALEQVLGNIEGVLASDDPEFVHQLRVALRRLRSVMRLFGVTDQIDEVKWLAGELGATRDWDVFLVEVWPPMSAAYLAVNDSSADAAEEAHRVLAAAEALRAAARAEARAALRLPRTAQLILALTGMAITPAQTVTAALPEASVSTLPASPRDALAGSLAEFAARQLRKRRKRLLRAAEGLAELSADARHQLRIDAKKLRYAVDCFASLYRRERVSPWLAHLSAIQQALGEANDAATALALLDGLTPAEPLRLFAQGWFAAQSRAHVGEVAQQFKALSALRRL